MTAFVTASTNWEVLKGLKSTVCIPSWLAHARHERRSFVVGGEVQLGGLHGVVEAKRERAIVAGRERERHFQDGCLTPDEELLVIERADGAEAVLDLDSESTRRGGDADRLVTCGALCADIQA